MTSCFGQLNDGVAEWMAKLDKIWLYKFPQRHGVSKENAGSLIDGCRSFLNGDIINTVTHSSCNVIDVRSESTHHDFLRFTLGS